MFLKKNNIHVIITILSQQKNTALVQNMRLKKNKMVSSQNPLSVGTHTQDHNMF